MNTSPFICSLLLLALISTPFAYSTDELSRVNPLIRQVVSSDGHDDSLISDSQFSTFKKENQIKNVGGEAQVPCYFVFGDSLFDNGNNNFLPTTARANYPPYGIDFPTGPNGRFTNGQNIADFLAKLLGFEDYIPPYTFARDDEILKGVNYASGGSGILRESGLHMGARITMDGQLVNHFNTVTRIKALSGDTNGVADHLSKCLYTVGMGNNDYLNNYFEPELYPTNYLYTPEEFADHLIEKYSNQLKTLYKLGARKVALFGLGLIGCTLYELEKYGPTSGSVCVDFINAAVQLANTRLVSLVDDFNQNLENATFIYINSTSMALTPAAELTVLGASCCEVKEGHKQCLPYGTACSNRTEYAFWDAVHQTEAAYEGIAQRSYDALVPTDAYPFDIKRLIQL